MLPLCFGTYRQNSSNELLNTVDAAIRCGIRIFDTAPSYHTEKILADALTACMDKYHLFRKDIMVIDKIDAWQMQDGEIEKNVLFALNEMRMDYLDILLIHWPIPEYLMQTWEKIIKVQRAGLIKKIGICNVRTRHLKEIISKSVKPDYIQIERHPLWCSKNEVDFCKQNGINVMSYSPLCRMDSRLIESPTLQKLSQKYSKTIGQIILRWHVDSECIPVFMSKNEARIRENTDIFDFSLEPKEVELINCMDSQLKISLESWGCPGF